MYRDIPVKIGFRVRRRNRAEPNDSWGNTGAPPDTIPLCLPGYRARASYSRAAGSRERTPSEDPPGHKTGTTGPGQMAEFLIGRTVRLTCSSLSGSINWTRSLNLWPHDSTTRRSISGLRSARRWGDSRAFPASQCQGNAGWGFRGPADPVRGITGHPLRQLCDAQGHGR